MFAKKVVFFKLVITLVQYHPVTGHVCLDSVSLLESKTLRFGHLPFANTKSAQISKIYVSDMHFRTLNFHADDIYQDRKKS